VKPIRLARIGGSHDVRPRPSSDDGKTLIREKDEKDDTVARVMAEMHPEEYCFMSAKS